MPTSEEIQAKVRRSVYLYRGGVVVLLLAVLGAWVGVGMAAVTMTMALIVTGVCAVSWVVLSIITSQIEKRSGLRPDGGVKWNGEIGGDDV
ncbi:MAG: hypothetical protein AB7S36_22500 [Planctomycetota bacterium]